MKFNTGDFIFWKGMNGRFSLAKILWKDAFQSKYLVLNSNCELVGKTSVFDNKLFHPESNSLVSNNLTKLLWGVK